MVQETWTWGPPSLAVQSQRGPGTPLTSLGLLALAVRRRDWTEVATGIGQMCLVWLTVYFKHIQTHCQSLKIEQFPSEIQIARSPGELRRSDASGQLPMEGPRGNYFGSQLEGPGPSPAQSVDVGVCDPATLHSSFPPEVL